MLAKNSFKPHNRCCTLAWKSLCVSVKNGRFIVFFVFCQHNFPCQDLAVSSINNSANRSFVTEALQKPLLRVNQRIKPLLVFKNIFCWNHSKANFSPTLILCTFLPRSSNIEWIFQRTFFCLQGYFSIICWNNLGPRLRLKIVFELFSRKISKSHSAQKHEGRTLEEWHWQHINCQPTLELC